MDAREQLRARSLPAIARLARSRDFRATFAVVANGSGEQTIIPALSDDTVGYVLDRLREAGGSAVLVLETAEKLQMAALLPASPARIALAEEDGTMTPVSDNCHVSMLFDYLTQVGTAVLKRAAVTARLVDQGPLQLV